MKQAISTFFVTVQTFLVCSLVYVFAVWCIAQAFTSETANGSLVITQDGRVIGSELVAQAFDDPRYFWPRPSAVDYNGAGAAGSNLSPTNPAITERAQATISRYGSVSPDRPIPADLVTASGSGLDPDISLEGALYQVPRVAVRRNLEASQIEVLIRDLATDNPLSGAPRINVLRLNLAIDALSHSTAMANMN